MSWAVKKAECWRIDAFELWCWRRFFRVPWTARRSTQSILKEIRPDYSLERHAEAEAPVLWPPDENSWLIRKDPDAKKDWGQEEKGATEDEMIEWHHWLNGYEFEQTPGDSEGQGSLLKFIGSQRVKHNLATGQLRQASYDFSILILNAYLRTLGMNNQHLKDSD